MAYGNNRAGEQPRAHFRLAGGSIIKFRHPYFAGMIDTGTNDAIDEIDVSACCKLEGRFFEANQNQDSAKQVVMIDGSTVTIANKMLNGTITIPAVPTTGEVGTGDFIAGCQLIRSIGDSVGGVLTKTDFVNGKALTKVYYGVTVQRCPDDVSEGNDVATYNVQLLYAGWIEAESGSDDLNKKAIWAVGSKEGIEAFYNPYYIQNQDGNTGTGSSMLEDEDLAPVTGTKISDSIANSADNSEEVKDIKDNSKTWGKLITGASVIPETTSSSDSGDSGTNP
jgi:hypothetical protein